ncbi:MAG: type II secretion system F family protein [Synergistetes bacterium]|nr:type II secretion system F family protein [Synergistota bacterium]
MADFRYRAKNKVGLIVEGTLEAESKAEAVAKLTENGLYPLLLRPYRGSILSKNINMGFFNPIRLRDIVVFSRQFAVMLKAGLPVADALRILVDQTENPKLADIISEMRQRVEEGETLSDTLMRHPKVFSNLYVTMVRAGEAGGMLDASLDRLATYLEKELGLRRKVASAMFYPVVLLSVSASVVVLLLTFVIPRFVAVLRGLNVPLPVITQKVLAFQQLFDRYKWFIAVFVVVAVILLHVLSKLPSLRLFFDRMKLRTPIIGALRRKVVVARFSRTLGALIGAGVPLLEVLEIVARISGNEVISQAVMFARTRVREGQALGESLELTEVFPLMVTKMITVGETTGNVEDMAMKVADFFDEEVETKVAALSAALEPLLIIIVGGIVGFIALSMFLPLFNLIGGLAMR